MISLSPLPSAHPSCFQPTLVRASTRCYPRFTLAKGRSPRFASIPSDSSPISDSLSLRLADRLTSPVTSNSPARYAKSTPSPPMGLRPLVGTRFQVLFHSPSGGLFTFPSRYLSAIGHLKVLSLGGWSPQVQSAFHGSGLTQERLTGDRAVSSTGRLPSVVRGSTRFG